MKYQRSRKEEYFQQRKKHSRVSEGAYCDLNIVSFDLCNSIMGQNPQLTDRPEQSSLMHKDFESHLSGFSAQTCYPYPAYPMGWNQDEGIGNNFL